MLRYINCFNLDTIELCLFFEHDRGIFVYQKERRNHMNLQQTHPSVILLMNNGAAIDHNPVRRWLENSRFNTCEAENIFEALELITDFTDRQRPDVVLLEVESPASEFAAFHRLVDSGPDDCEHAIFALREDGETGDDSDCCHGSFAELASRLEGLIPQNMAIAA